MLAHDDEKLSLFESTISVVLLYCLDDLCLLVWVVLELE